MTSEKLVRAGLAACCSGMVSDVVLAECACARLRAVMYHNNQPRVLMATMEYICVCLGYNGQVDVEETERRITEVVSHLPPLRGVVPCV